MTKFIEAVIGYFQLLEVHNSLNKSSATTFFVGIVFLQSIHPRSQKKS
jgi:hypothetical protein